MQEVEIKITNGYGINKFTEKISFNTASKSHNTIVAVYAQNGTMKSSLARTLNDHKNNISIKDHIFDDKGSCAITCNGQPVPLDDILAINSFDTGKFEANDISSLVASEPIKKEYDELIAQYDEAWRDLIGKIKKVARPNIRWRDNDVLSAIITPFGENLPKDSSTLINLFKNKSDRTDIDNAPDFIQKIPYPKLDTAQVDNFIQKNSGIIAKLIEVYDEIRKSPTFYKNGFDATGARKFADAAKDSNYFDAEHFLRLTNIATGIQENIGSDEELEQALSTDIDAILDKQPKLRKPFEKLINDFGKGNHGDLRNILEDNETKDIVLLMDNPRIFRRSLWHSYLKACREEADKLIEISVKIEKDLKDVILKAQAEHTKWDEIAQKFNERFRNLPYTVHIENKDSLIFKDTSIPVMILRYQHQVDANKRVDFKKDAGGEYRELAHLSTGERKAFYLLNILFELEVRQQSSSPQLVVLDDIVDSFDYKNKYAFLEYIHEIASDNSNLRIVLMTHNFDFFRLLQSRLQNDSDHFMIASKRGGITSMSEANCFEIFGYMRRHAHENQKVWLATIPFVRNLLEYQTGDLRDPTTNYMKLTESLHSLDNDQDIATIQSIFNSQLGITTHPFRSGNAKVSVTLISVANAINDDDDFNIFDNIILALACRRMAEDYMKYKISDPLKIETAKNNTHSPFTRALYRIYSNNSSDLVENKKKIAEVNLITPEHIHLNAFAYEPLIDISKHELVKLRDDLIALHSTTS